MQNCHVRNKDRKNITKNRGNSEEFIIKICHITQLQFLSFTQLFKGFFTGSSSQQMIPTQKMYIYKNNLNFSVTSCFLYTMSADIAHRGKALKTQFKEMSFLNITFSLGHSEVFVTVSGPQISRFRAQQLY